MSAIVDRGIGQRYDFSLYPLLCVDMMDCSCSVTKQTSYCFHFITPLFFLLLFVYQYIIFNNRFSSKLTAEFNLSREYF